MIHQLQMGTFSVGVCPDPVQDSEGPPPGLGVHAVSCLLGCRQCKGYRRRWMRSILRWVVIASRASPVGYPIAFSRMATEAVRYKHVEPGEQS